MFDPKNIHKFIKNNARPVELTWYECVWVDALNPQLPMVKDMIRYLKSGDGFNYEKKK